MKYKLIASDIDGTLLPFGNKAFSERTLAAAEKCRKHGIAFTIFTGRSFVNALKAAEQLGIKGPIVTANGSIVMGTDGSVLKAWSFDKETAVSICRDLTGMGLRCSFYCPEGVYRLDESAPASFTVTTINARTFVNAVNDRELFFGTGADHVCKIESYSDDPALMKSLAERYAEQGFGASQAYPVNVEILPPGCGKGRALLWLCEYMGIRREECAAIGDNTNDIEMIRAAGVGIAMGNAAPELKEASDTVTEDAENDGAARAIDRLIAEGS